MVIVTAADDRFALPLGVMVHSLLANARPEAEMILYVLSDGISPRHRQRIESVVARTKKDRIVDFRWMDVQPDRPPSNRDAPPPLRTTDFISDAAYLRLLIPNLLPETQDRAIYLDADLLVERDLTPLWKAPFDEAHVLAVRDYKIQTVSHQKGLAHYHDFGLSPDTPYFNSGVLVINLNAWRTEHVRADAMRYVARYRQVMNACDQEALNAVLAGRWKELDPRWNRQSAISDLDRWPESSFKRDIESQRDALLHAPYIDHFTGNDKPWNILTDHPSKDRFLDYLASSGWFSPLEFRAWRGFRTARIPEQYLRNLTRPLRHRASRLLRID